MNKRSIYLSFADLQGPVVLTGCAELTGIIAQVLRGWDISPYEGPHDTEPVIRIEKSGTSFIRHSRWLDEPISFDDPVDAVCDFLVDLTKAYLDTATGMMCLHGAAAHFNSGLMIFPSTYHAGKSTLCVELARRGVRIFSDDVLPIENNRNFGVAPGILPRLRRPLPENAGTGLQGYMKSRASAASDRFQYVDLHAHELAPLGETAPISGIVLLERDDANSPELLPARESDIVKNIILRNFSKNVAAADVLDRLIEISWQADTHILKYATVEQAAELLCQRFGAKMSA